MTTHPVSPSMNVTTDVSWPPHLIEAVDDLEQAVPGAEFGVAPERRVDGRGRVTLDESPTGDVPRNRLPLGSVGGVGDDRIGQAGNVSPFDALEVDAVVRGQCRFEVGKKLPGRLGRRTASLVVALGQVVPLV